MKTLNTLFQEAIYYNQEGKLKEWFKSLLKKERELFRNIVIDFAKVVKSESRPNL